jgi:hypothetical protein
MYIQENPYLVWGIVCSCLPRVRADSSGWSVVWFTDTLTSNLSELQLLLLGPRHALPLLLLREGEGDLFHLSPGPPPPLLPCLVLTLAAGN